MSDKDSAPEGQTWVCGACGKSSKVRAGLRDTSCQTWAVLVYDDSITRDPRTGLVNGGKAVTSAARHILPETNA